MTGWEVAWLGVTLAVMGVGVLGCVLPVLPGAPLIFAVAVVHRWLAGPVGAQGWVLTVMGVLAGFSLVLEHVASLYGAKVLGATRWGMIGAVAGGLVGLFFWPFGVLVGPFIGAVVLEMAGGRAWQASTRAGAGATLGLLVGAGGKVACAMGMILLFLTDVVWRAWPGGAVTV